MALFGGVHDGGCRALGIVVEWGEVSTMKEYIEIGQRQLGLAKGPASATHHPFLIED